MTLAQEINFVEWDYGNSVGEDIEDPDVVAYVSSIRSISDLQLSALTLFVSRLKSSGLWSLIELMMPFCGDSLSCAITPLKKPAGCVITNSGYTDSDYTPVGGLVGNGTSKSLQITKYVPTDLTTFHCSAFLPTSVANSSTGAAIANSASGFLLEPVVTGTPQFSLGGIACLGFPKAAYQAFFAGSYINGTARQYTNGVSNASSNGTLPSIPTAFGILCAENFGQRLQASIGLATIGAGLTTTQMQQLNAYVHDFMFAIGRKPPIYMATDLVGIVCSGQSLSQGTAAGAVASAQAIQNYNNLMFNFPSTINGSGVNTAAKQDGGLAPLISYPESNGNGEAFSKGGLDGLAANLFKTYVLLGSGVNAADYATLKQGTGPYNTALAQATEAKRLAALQGKRFTVAQVWWNHGEYPDTIQDSVYAPTNVPALQAAYQTDLQAITGQGTAIPMLIRQTASWISSGEGFMSPWIAQQILDVYLANTATLPLIGPSYQYTYLSDSPHMLGANYRVMGDYYAKVAWTLMLGNSWAPLYPLSVTRTTGPDQITVVMNRGGLLIDTTLVSDNTGNVWFSHRFNTSNTLAADTKITTYKGFEFVDDTNPASVTITGHSITTTNIANDTIVLTLSGTPTGTNKRLRYAWTGDNGRAGGASPPAGSGTSGALSSVAPRGNIRVPDATGYVGQSGADLSDWLCVFDKAAT